MPYFAIGMVDMLLSVLAGDIFGKTPIWRSIFMFKVLYYTAMLFQPRVAWMARKKRAMNIRYVDQTGIVDGGAGARA